MNKNKLNIKHANDNLGVKIKQLYLQNEFQPAQEVITETPEASGAASGTTNLKEVKEAPKVDAVKSEPTEAVTNGDQKDAVSVEHF